LIAEALTGLRSRSCIIDGEAVACDDNGLASFDRIRYRQHDSEQRRRHGEAERFCRAEPDVPDATAYTLDGSESV
jgi:ATP-dependent DNA ligase